VETEPLPKVPEKLPIVAQSAEKSDKPGTQS
jgi:hypothetical protein